MLALNEVYKKLVTTVRALLDNSQFIHSILLMLHLIL